MQVFPGFTINSVLDTDYETLINTINAVGPAKQEEQKPKAMSLKDFVQSMG
jgi:hypothetical protein